MSGIAKNYVAPECTTTELDCEGSFCLISSNGILDVDHDGFVGEDCSNGWDN